MSRLSSTLLLFALGLPLAGCNGAVTDLGSPPQATGAIVTQEVVIGPPSTAPVSFSGLATLVRDAAGLTLSGQSDDFVAGNAYTIWAVIFENPEQCVGTRDGPDLDLPQVQGTVPNFGGFVGNPDGTFTVTLTRHDDSRQTLRGAGRSGIDNPYQAEVHFIFRSHGLGETNLENLAAQLSTVAGFCNLPAIGCEEQGLAVFAPPGPPGQR